MRFLKEKEGQITIWAIIAIVIVATILLFLFLRKEIEVPGEIFGTEIQLIQYIDKCVMKNVNEGIDIMLPNGGFIEPAVYKRYKGINVGYLCYNSGNYYPCINQHPMLLNEMRDELKDYIEPEINNCFDNLKTELEKRNSAVDMKNMQLEVEFAPDRVFVNINRELITKHNDATSKYEEFDIEIINPIYNLGRLAMEIASQEAEYCYFEYNGYMILYPEYKISLSTMSDSTRIYTIKDKNSEKEMNIAIRGCTIPPGL